MKQLILLIAAVMTVLIVNAQNCSQVTYGNPAYIPINDLETGNWKGFPFSLNF